jgi:hypothetical protein
MTPKLILTTAAALSLIALATTGCRSPSLMDKMALGTYEMRADRDPLDDTFAEHVYFTREAASGGRGVGGGGCGCN